MKKSPPLALLAFALVAGVVLRLIWPLDIEMKFDEAETFNFLRDWVRGDIAFPWVGQPSSNGLRHPGLGIWLFLFLGKAFFVEMIIDLARVPPVLAILNFFVLIGFAYGAFRQRARGYFLWAVALMAVNPFAVLLDRKLWHPSVMGIFVSGFLLAWLKRRSWVGSFFLGMFALLPGQIHMSGFFLVLGFFAFDLFRHRRAFFRAFCWPAMALGGALGLAPMVPWIYWIWQDVGKGGGVSSTFTRLFSLKFPNYWFTNAFGILGSYPFGNQVYQKPLYLVVTAALAMMMIAGIIIFFRRAVRFFRRRGQSAATQLEMFSCFGTGLIATFSLMHIPRYFTLCLGFAPFLSAVRSLSLLPRARLVLTGLILVQAVASCFLLSFVHYYEPPADNPGVPVGVFGLPARICGSCPVGPAFETIDGGSKLFPTKEIKKAEP